MQAFVPATVLSEQLKAREIATLNNLRDLVVGNVRLLLAFLDLLDENLLHLHGANLLGALHRTFPLFDLEVSIDGLVVHEDSLEDLTSGLKLLDCQKALTHDVHNIVELVFGIIHGQVERVVPDLFELILVLEVSLCDLHVAVDCLAIFTLLFPDLCTV